MAKLNAAVESGDFRDQRNDHPEGLVEARKKLTALVDEICEQTDLELSQIVLGGFSQGSMLATDVALRLPDPPGLLCVLSGTLLCEDDWRELAAERGELPVFQSHGNQDPLLPFQAAEWLRDLFAESGMDVEFLPFTGPHTIPAAAVGRIAVRLAELVEKTGEPGT